MNSVQSKTIDKCQGQGQKTGNDVKFRWAAEFMAGPGGFLEKAEVMSKWFTSFDEAEDHAWKNYEREVNEYPYSRGTILKLLVEDNKGTITELSNAKKTRERYM